MRRSELERAEGDHRHYRRFRFPFMRRLAVSHWRSWPQTEPLDGDGIYLHRHLRGSLPAAGLPLPSPDCLIVRT